MLLIFYVVLYLRILTDVPLKIHGFNIILTDGNEIFKLKGFNYLVFNNINELRKYEIENSNEKNNSNEITNSYKFNNDLKLEPEKCYKILFTTQSHQFLENVQLQVRKNEIFFLNIFNILLFLFKIVFFCMYFRYLV